VGTRLKQPNNWSYQTFTVFVAVVTATVKSNIYRPVALTPQTFWTLLMHTIRSYFKNILKFLGRKVTDYQPQVKTSVGHTVAPDEKPDPYAILNDKSGQLAGFQSFLDSALHLQLELIRSSMNLTTAAILCVGKSSEQLVILSIVSSRPDILSGPFSKGVGLTAALLRGRNEVSIDHASDNYAGMIYYEHSGGIGSAIALRASQDNTGVGGSNDDLFILCVDREDVSEWSENDKNLLHLAVDKMFMDQKLSKLLNNIELERSIIQKICTSFRELNHGLDLKSVFQATYNAINNLLSVDCVAINLTQRDIHYIAFIRGGINERLLGMEYGINEGLVGQVLKLDHSLPANAFYNGDAPVFSKSHCLVGYKSLFIIPLRPEKGDPIGTLTVAAKPAHMFGKVQLDILSLIADQAAIKIDLAKSHELINKMATTDGLTSLANHRTFQHGFDIMLHRAKRRTSPLAMILCDIDFFKKFNDSYGHQFGDKVLKQVAATMASAIRKVDLAARYGGEEFALILENSDKRGAFIMAERIRQDIAALKFSFEGHQIGVTISMGIAAYPEDELEKSQLIELADNALYKAKERGRNQTVLA